MSKFGKLRKVGGDHPFDLTDGLGRNRTKVVTQSAYFRSGDVVVGIAELNRRNQWDDEAFDAACKFLQKAWNEAVSRALGTPASEGEE